jgi:hypothetical protein
VGRIKKNNYERGLRIQDRDRFVGAEEVCNLESAPESHATTGGDPLESAGILE